MATQNQCHLLFNFLLPPVFWSDPQLCFQDTLSGIVIMVLMGRNGMWEYPNIIHKTRPHGSSLLSAPMLYISLIHLPAQFGRTFHPESPSDLSTSTLRCHVLGGGEPAEATSLSLVTPHTLRLKSEFPVGPSSSYPPPRHLSPCTPAPLASFLFLDPLKLEPSIHGEGSLFQEYLSHAHCSIVTFSSFHSVLRPEETFHDLSY